MPRAAAGSGGAVAARVVRRGRDPATTRRHQVFDHDITPAAAKDPDFKHGRGRVKADSLQSGNKVNGMTGNMKTSKAFLARRARHGQRCPIAIGA